MIEYGPLIFGILVFLGIRFVVKVNVYIHKSKKEVHEIHTDKREY